MEDQISTAGRVQKSDAEKAESANSEMGRPSSIRWPVIWTALTVITGLLTVALHFLGLVVNRAYLAAWGVSPEHFPKSTDWLLLNGYYSAWSGIAMLWQGIWNNFHWVLLGSVTLMFYIYALLSPWNPFDKLDQNLSRIDHWPKWRRALVILPIIGSVLAVVLVPICLMLFVVVGVPATIGRTIGAQIVASSAADYAKGCESSKRMCTQLFRGEQKVGEGYVLDVSLAHIAYFDVVLKSARVMPKDGLELRATRTPASVEVK